MKFLKYSIVLFVLSLTGCFSPNKDNVNVKASVSHLDELPENPLLLIPMTFSINPKLNSMSTLYGNKTAMEYAKKNVNDNYPSGSLLYQVTWQQKSDSLWYGANIPDKIVKVERIEFKGNSEPKYEVFTGSPLKKNVSEPSSDRIKTIISQPAAVSP